MAAANSNISLLHKAIISKQAEIVSFILNSFKQSMPKEALKNLVNAEDDEGHTPLFYALNTDTAAETEEIALALLENGANGALGAALDKKTTALHLAVKRNFLKVCQILVAKDTNAITTKDEQSIDPMTLALAEEKKEIASFFWGELKEKKIASSSSAANTPAHQASASSSTSYPEVGLYAPFMKEDLVGVIQDIEKQNNNKQSILAYLNQRKEFLKPIYINGCHITQFLLKMMLNDINIQDLENIGLCEEAPAPENKEGIAQDDTIECFLHGEICKVTVRDVKTHALAFHEAIKSSDLRGVQDRKFDARYLSNMGIVKGGQWQSFLDLACEEYNKQSSEARLEIIRELLTQSWGRWSRGKILPSGDYEGEKTTLESVLSTNDESLIDDIVSNDTRWIDIRSRELFRIKRDYPARYPKVCKKLFIQEMQYFAPGKVGGLTRLGRDIILATIQGNKDFLLKLNCSPKIIDSIWMNGKHILELTQNEEIKFILRAKGAQPKPHPLDVKHIDNSYANIEISNQNYVWCFSDRNRIYYELYQATQALDADRIKSIAIPPEMLSCAYFRTVGEYRNIKCHGTVIDYQFLSMVLLLRTAENREKVIAVAKALIEKYEDKGIPVLFWPQASHVTIKSYGAFHIAILLDSNELFQLLLKTKGVIITEDDILLAEQKGKKEWADELRRKRKDQSLSSSVSASSMTISTSPSPQSFPSSASASSVRMSASSSARSLPKPSASSMGMSASSSARSLPKPSAASSGMSASSSSRSLPKPSASASSARIPTGPLPRLLPRPSSLSNPLVRNNTSLPLQPFPSSSSASLEIEKASLPLQSSASHMASVAINTTLPAQPPIASSTTSLPEKFTTVWVPTRMGDLKGYIKEFKEKKETIPKEVDTYFMNSSALKEIGQVAEEAKMVIPRIMIKFGRNATLASDNEVGFKELIQLGNLTQVYLVFHKKMPKEMRSDITKKIEKCITHCGKKIPVDTIKEKKIKERTTKEYTVFFCNSDQDRERSHTLELAQPPSKKQKVADGIEKVTTQITDALPEMNERTQELDEALRGDLTHSKAREVEGEDADKEDCAYHLLSLSSSPGLASGREVSLDNAKRTDKNRSAEVGNNNANMSTLSGMSVSGFWSSPLSLTSSASASSAETANSETQSYLIRLYSSATKTQKELNKQLKRRDLGIINVKESLNKAKYIVAPSAVRSLSSVIKQLNLKIESIIIDLARASKENEAIVSLLEGINRLIKKNKINKIEISCLDVDKTKTDFFIEKIKAGIKSDKIIAVVLCDPTTYGEEHNIKIIEKQVCIEPSEQLQGRLTGSQKEKTANEERGNLTQDLPLEDDWDIEEVTVSDSDMGAEDLSSEKEERKDPSQKRKRETDASQLSRSKKQRRERGLILSSESESEEELLSKSRRDEIGHEARNSEVNAAIPGDLARFLESPVKSPRLFGTAESAEMRPPFGNTRGSSTTPTSVKTGSNGTTPTPRSPGI